MRRINVKREAAPPEQVDEVVAAIRANQLVALPTETVYGLAADPQVEASVQRLQAAKGRAAEHVFTVHIDAVARLAEHAELPPRRLQKLLHRYWPGPLTVVLSRPGSDTETVGLRVPAHPFTQAVLAQFPKGLYLTSANRTGEPPAVHAEEVVAAIPDLDLLCDGGATPLGHASSVVRITRNGDLQVLREGMLTEAELRRAGAFDVLFVCTGNTCRSPLAEAHARRALIAALGLGDDQALRRRGFWVHSAGTNAYPGEPASQGSMQAGAEVDLDLAAHRATQVDPEAVAMADRIYCLSASHLSRLVGAVPAAAAKATLLDPSGDDIPDPFGGDLAVYRGARDRILSAVDARVAEIVAAADA